jgi:hypothetical protein
MKLKRHKILTCKSLAHVLEPMVNDKTEIKVLDIALHVDPNKLRARLLEEVALAEDQDTDILLGYGLCGRALEGVVSSSSTLIMPKVDDCVCALLGSRERRRELLNKDAGCYFLDQHWLDTGLNIFSEIMRGLEKIPYEKRDRIIKLTLKNYHTLVLLDSGDLSQESESVCMGYAEQYDMDLIRVKTDHGLLTRLIKGPWSEEEFLVLSPGKPVPFF